MGVLPVGVLSFAHKHLHSHAPPAPNRTGTSGVSAILYHGGLAGSLKFQSQHNTFGTESEKVRPSNVVPKLSAALPVRPKLRFEKRWKSFRTLVELGQAFVCPSASLIRRRTHSRADSDRSRVVRQPVANVGPVRCSSSGNEPAYRS